MGGRPVRGDVEVFPAGKRVERAIDGASEDINVLLDGVFLKRVAAETGANPDRLEVFDLFNARDPQIERLLLSFLPELETEGLGSELMPSHWPTPWLSTSCASTPRSGMQGLQTHASLPASSAKLAASRNVRSSPPPTT